jgi:hypothetical protein
MAQFYSVDNFETCNRIFKKYLGETYDLSASQVDEMDDLPKLLYSEMKALRDSGEAITMSLKDANNAVLNRLKKGAIERYKLVSNKKPMMKNLARDQNVYGERPIATTQLKPASTNISSEKEMVSKSFEHLLSERQTEMQNVAPVVNVKSEGLDKPIDTDEFNRKLSDIEKTRDDYFQASVGITMDMPQNEPNEFYRTLYDERNRDVEKTKEKGATDFNDMINTKQLELINNQKSIHTTRYLTINGFDRRWRVFKHRFMYTVDLYAKLKNIASFKITKLIIPMEIVEDRTLSNIPKQNYQHEFSFSFPYVHVNIDQIQDVYEGSNDNIRKSTALFIFDSAYKAPNGRGYVMLKPMQDEEKSFYPVPLGSLSQLSVSVRKPNGALYNHSMDNHKVIKLEYEEFNRLYIKVVVDKYFDKNELSIGDIVMVKDASIVKTIASQQPDSVYRDFNSFLNRAEGHEIVQLGQPNSEGFYRNFYIFAPGSLDQETGKISLDVNQIEALKEAIGVVDAFNGTIDCNSCLSDCVTDAQQLPPTADTTVNTNFIEGSLLNASVQITLAFKVVISQSDSSILNTVGI